jgi:hypothetical protein
MSSDGATSRSPSGLRRLLQLYVFIAVVLVAYPWLRPMLAKMAADGCHPGNKDNIREVAMTLCVNSRNWNEILTFEPGKTSFSAGGTEKIFFHTFGQLPAIPAAELPSLILEYSTQYATNDEKLEVIKQWPVTLAGRQWQAMEFASHTADLVVYYYSSAEFGSAELFFMSFKEDVAKRDALADPILKSISFGKSAASQPNA